MRRAERLGVRRAMVVAWQGLGNGYAMAGRRTEAAAEYRKALDLAERIRTAETAAELRKQLAEVEGR